MISPPSPPPVSIGRRIYIQRDCFRLAGDLRPEARGEIAFTMWSMRIIKMVRHHLVDDAELLGLTRPQEVDAALGRLTDAFWPPVSELLRQSVIAPARNRHDGPPVLQPHEAICGSCFFDGYYTFATGQVASDEMLADTRSIVEIRSGSLDDGTPLTLVRGNRLRFTTDRFTHSGVAEAKTSVETTLAGFASAIGRFDGDEYWARVIQTCLVLADRMLAAHPF